MTEFSHPLAVQQKTIWLSQQLDPDKSLNVGGYIDIHAVVDSEVMVEAIRRAIAEASALLVNITFSYGQPRQYRRDLEFWTPSVTDYSLFADGESRARMSMDQLMRKSFDLEKDHLFRAELITISEDRSFLCFVSHHTVADGASCFLIGHRILQWYSALLSHTELERPKYLDIDDILAEIERYENSTEFQRDRDFWNGYIDRSVEPLRLERKPQPCDRVTIHRTISMPHDQLQSLSRMSVVLNLPLPAILTAAASLAYRAFAQTNDFYLQFPVANRVGPARWTPCMLSNVVPLRVTLDPNSRFSELCSTVVASMQSTQRHSKYPIANIRRDLGTADRDRDIFGPVVNVMPFLASVPIGNGRGTLLPLPENQISELSARFSYDLDGGTGGLIELVADSRVYGINDLEKYMNAIIACLEQVAADPAVRLADIQVLNPAERAQVLTDWNNTHTPIDTTTLVDLFHATVAATPEAVAVIDNATHHTYRQLDTRATTLARRLIETGVGPDHIVAVALDRSFDLIAAILAVLKAGGAYLPIDPTYPPERLAYILTDADPVAILTTHTIHPTLPYTPTKTILTDDIHDNSPNPGPDPHDHGNEQQPQQALRPSNLAYIIYTSGSTGTPKPVAVTHHNVVNLALHVWALDSSDRMLVHSSIAFDASTFEVWPALLGGGGVVVATGTGGDLQQLERLVAQHRVTAMFLTSPLLPVLADRLHTTNGSLTGLRQLMVGGDMFPSQAAQRILRALPSLRMINGYGPTEGTACNVSHLVDIDADVVSVPIGRPIANARVWVLDSWLRPVPVGVAGELYIA
ncbi:AMP-binding protein, partial [Nocardia sp. NPDC049220]|uniref:AMP-binding protein n=1 Tax=Nocardia sp. NPDC049220 TaxID=3155273 RepID=UPI0033F417B5